MRTSGEWSDAVRCWVCGETLFCESPTHYAYVCSRCGEEILLSEIVERGISISPKIPHSQFFDERAHGKYHLWHRWPQLVTNKKGIVYANA